MYQREALPASAYKMVYPAGYDLIAEIYTEVHESTGRGQADYEQRQQERARNPIPTYDTGGILSRRVTIPEE